MKEIKAIIQPFMLERVLHALEALGDLPGLTVSQVTGWGRSREAESNEPVTERGHRLAAKTKIEIVVPDEMVDRLVEAILDSAHTGRVGDGKIFVSDVLETVKVRTRATGIDAL